MTLSCPPKERWRIQRQPRPTFPERSLSPGPDALVSSIHLAGSLGGAISWANRVLSRSELQLGSVAIALA